jgi:hypothetical protein
MKPHEGPCSHLREYDHQIDEYIFLYERWYKKGDSRFASSARKPESLDQFLDD